MIALTVKEWADIRNRLREDYAWKPSIFMIRDTMRRELGFLPRFHRVYHEQTGYTETVCLDFYDDSIETMFRLKYL
jgi:hypothetical protein